MKLFMKLSTSIMFGLLVAGSFMFPVLAIAAVLAWIYISQEYDEPDFDGFVFKDPKDDRWIN